MLHTRAGREAAPARDPAARRRENPRMHTPTDQSRQSRRAKAAKWDEAEFRWRAGMAFKINSQFINIETGLAPSHSANGDAASRVSTGRRPEFCYEPSCPRWRVRFFISS